MTYFDIETLALDDKQLERVKPAFKAPGNFKDPLKIAASIAEQEAEWRARAALSPLTGRVALIGLLRDNVSFLQADDEAALLEAFWDEWKRGGRFVGFCVKSFDLPFLFRRSVVNRVALPTDLFEGRYWSRRFADLQELWCCYSNRTEGQSLDAICKACNLPGKSGTGADFGALWASDKQAALDYCQQDLECAAALGALLGLETPVKPF